MPFETPNLDMLGVALVLVASLALLVTIASRGKSDGKRPAEGAGSEVDGEPSAVIPAETYQGATDHRLRELESRLKAVEGELRKINHELSKR